MKRVFMAVVRFFVKIWTFILECVGEMKKVVWPDKESIFSSVKVVLVSTSLFAVFFWLVDFLAIKGLYLFF